MSFELGYDLTDALQRRNDRISLKGIEALRLALTGSKGVPETVTDKQVIQIAEDCDE